ncbi:MULTISPECIES: hypothetical protein [Natrinema]|uniref:Uncharacterized protein n=1 Tax=Natrinema gari JCM 14663 TaxID=1230459 RepID=L9YT75_9EURY|nr:MULTISPECIES: hypothetical protein [Natrinema]AFO59232.1 hypothetical protein NJ7G_4018 [Natrinema sp. J7-2]ELY77410.1 hypothetical protein C486_14939 [Natrinema gari JCM 14663]
MHLSRPVTAAAFWLGTLLPVVYPPVIVAGIDSLSRLSLFVGLVSIHALALVVGHDYSGSRSR